MQGLFDWVNLLLAILGAIPILVSAFYFWGNLLPIRRFFSFTTNEQVDIILTTSQVTHSAVGAKVVRATTGIGQIEGATTFSRFLGHYYHKKKATIQLSVSVHQRLENDIVIFGGPAKNEIAKQFLLHLNKDTPINMEFDDVNITLRLDDFVVGNKDIVIDNELPSNDYAIIAVWHNPFSINSRRGILCAGFTSYGTSGAANWLFNDLPKQKETSFFSKLRKKTNFVTILEVELVRGTVLSARPIKTLFFSNDTVHT